MHPCIFTPLNVVVSRALVVEPVETTFINYT